MQRRSLIIDPEDTVAVMLEDGKKGDTITTPGGLVTLLENIEFAHKVAIFDHKEHQPVIKYGGEIGYVVRDVPKGSWIHNHNMACDRGKKRREI